MPRKGQKRIIDGILYVWDGQEWVRADRPTKAKGEGHGSGRFHAPWGTRRRVRRGEPDAPLYGEHTPSGHAKSSIYGEDIEPLEHDRSSLKDETRSSGPTFTSLMLDPDTPEQEEAETSGAPAERHRGWRRVARVVFRGGKVIESGGVFGKEMVRLRRRRPRRGQQ